MSITIKSDQEIAVMRQAGRIVATVLEVLKSQVKPGMKTEELDDMAAEEVEKLGSKQGGLMMIYGLYPGVPLANVQALMDAMERYMGYYA